MPLATNFAQDGDLEMLERIYARPNHRQLISPDAMDRAAACGHLNVVQWFYERFPDFLSPSCLVAAAKNAHMHVLQWLEHFHLRVWQSCVVDAAATGQVDVLRWLRAQDLSVWTTIYPEAMIQAAKQGRLEVLKYYHEECGLELHTRILDSMTKCKTVAVYEYILDRVSAAPTDLAQLLHYAASASSLEVVEYLVTQRHLWNREAFEAAVYRCRTPVSDRNQSRPENLVSLEVSQFLLHQARIRAESSNSRLETHVNLDNICIVHVADLKNYETAEWLARSVPEADCDPDGLLDGNDYPPSDKEATAAARVVLACLRHRREQCRAVEWMPRWAVVANCVQAFDLLVEMEHPWLGSMDVQRAIMEHSRDGRFLVPLLSRMHHGTLSTDIATWAASFGIRSVLDRIYAEEVTAKRQRLLQLVATRGAANGHVEVLDWVLAHCHVDRLPVVIVFKDAANEGARCGFVDVLQWMHEHAGLLSAEGDIVSGIVREAARHHQVECLRWLFRMLSVSTHVVGQILKDAVQRQDEAVVQCVTVAYGPNDLWLSKADTNRVRDFVRKFSKPQE